MGKFLDVLKLIPYADGVNWCVADDFRYQRDDGSIVTVLKGFITDFASVPRVFWNLVGPPWGKYGPASVVHDFDYWDGKSKEQADNDLWDCMNLMGVGFVDRDIIYEAVHKYGQDAWDENAKKKALGFTRIAPDLPQSMMEFPFTWVGSTGDWKKG